MLRGAEKLDRRVDAAAAAVETRSISIDLIPLLAPYKKHGKLSLRVERLPQQTRLSKGSRNNDGSWSLMRDDLDDLEYQVPDGVEAARVLSVRVVSLAAGNTLAVLEVPVTADGAAAVAGERASGGEQDGQAQLLREELAKLKASVAERDAALTDLRRAASGADAQLADAREIWQREAQQAVVAAERAWQSAEAARLREAEAKWQAQANAALAQRAEADAARVRESDNAARKAGEKAAALEAVLAERNAAHEALVRESREALAAAESAWRAEEASRLAAAEARWREASAKAVADAGARSGEVANVELAEVRKKLASVQAQLGEREAALARAEANASREHESVGEARSLREKLAALQAVLAERDASLARADQVRAELQREARDALSVAEQKWRAEEAQRAAAAEARWREASAKALAEAGVAHERTQGAEVSELREKIAVLQATVHERDEALAHAEELEIERRAQAEQELSETLTRAEVVWKADEAVRLAEAESRWREAAAASHPVAAGGAAVEAEARAMREKVSALQSKLAEREASLVKARQGSDEERMKWQREAQEAIARATKEWIAKEGSRRAATEAQVRKEVAEQLAHATQRYEQAEAALAQIRIRAGKDDGGRAAVELDGARSALVLREQELTRLRAEVEALRQGGAVATTAAPVAAAPEKRSYARDAGIAAAFGVAIVAAYPFVEMLLTPAPPPAPAPKVEVAPPPPKPELDTTATMATDAKLRAGPSTKVGVIAALSSGTDVTVIEERGEWLRVRAPGKPLREGWVKIVQVKNFTSMSDTAAQLKR